MCDGVLVFCHVLLVACAPVLVSACGRWLAICVKHWRTKLRACESRVFCTCGCVCVYDVVLVVFVFMIGSAGACDCE